MNALPTRLSCLRLPLLLALSAISSLALAQDEDEDEAPQFVPGLVATYRAGGQAAFSRLDPEIAFAWGANPPDTRLSDGPFEVDWRGRLLAVDSGGYRLHVFAAGSVRIELAGRVILDSHGDEPGWMAAEPIELDFGYYPLHVAYRRGQGTGRIALYWQGPQFQLEPLADRWLWHEPFDTPDSRFERGELLSRALRCGACHELPADTAPLQGPALSRLAGHIDRGWLVAWLQSHGEEQSPIPPREQSREITSAGEISRRMPYLGLSLADAESVADVLLSTSETVPPYKPPPPGKAEQGALLFRTVGCLACHEVDRLGEGGLFGGGDLKKVRQKRPADFLAHWLAAPHELNPSARMPVFRLTPEEISHLAAYLATFNGGQDAIEPSAEPPTTAERMERGRQLIKQFRCAACHVLPEKARVEGDAARRRPFQPVAGELTASCLAAPNAGLRRPGYQLRSSDRAALTAYLDGIRQRRQMPGKQPVVAAALSGRSVLAERNCLGCHARGAGEGIAARTERLLEVEPDLALTAAALHPPSLQGVGDKLHEKALAAAIKAEKPLRPWLRVRMPRFALSPPEHDALAEFLVTQDRIPPGANVSPPLPPADAQAAHLAGRRLVTADGFGCTSCHAIGGNQPKNVALNARGTDLALLEERIRRPWFDRWVRNPARIVPRMEMPSIKLPVRGVLNDRLDDQLAGVWSVLNTPGFEPPQPNPIRVLRHSGLADDHRLADVLTDVMESGPRVYIKPLAVGLRNRHNLLLDLADCRLAGWWWGDTARQRTRGKSWYWEVGGDPVWPPPNAGLPSEIGVLLEGKTLEPIPQGQFPTELDWLELTSDGVRFGHRLLLSDGGPQANLPLSVVQEIWATPQAPRNGNQGEGPLAGQSASGFRRRVEILGLPVGASALLRLTGPKRWRSRDDGRELVPDEDNARWQARTTGDGRFRLSQDGQIATILAAATSPDAAVILECEYQTTLPVDQYLAPELSPPALPITRLHTVPGCEVIQLPLPATFMPTGLAWRDEKTMLLTSLKGEVLTARDADGDGLLDTLQTFADGLAAPYGLAVPQEVSSGDGKAASMADVINKYALLRLIDRDGDGRADRWETAASGWGHTVDYHDWAVGLPCDNTGCYYVGLPSQQDDRSAAAANLRGTAIKLVPREPTAANPRRFSMETISAGLRFPMGLALNQRGDLFATDNQGNYNPFNELNHLQSGMRYGFINKLEARPGFNPPSVPAAIEIPHPWTRSVNGVCFLESAQATGNAGGQNLFGPFAGQIIGCEYDTRRLVRMSLQQVGDSYQGAVYPFSILPDDGESFEGPIVCAMSPHGDLYVGNIRDSGWGAGTNTGSLARIRPVGGWPLGLAEVRAVSDGFQLSFTGPVNTGAANAVSSYHLESYRRVATPAYGGPDLDRRQEAIREITVADDQMSVTLKLAELRAGFVYEFRLKPLGRAGEMFFPAEAHYTLRAVPR